MKTYIVTNDTTDEVSIGTMLSPDIAKNDQTLLIEGQKIANVRNSKFGNIGLWSARVIDTSELPGSDPNTFDKTFRAAYTDKVPGNQINIDIPKAKEIAHEMRREDRQKKMEPLDKEESFASTSDIRKNEIRSEKRAILDSNAAVQDAIDGSLDEDELRAVLKGAGIAD